MDQSELQRMVAYHSWSRGKYLDLFERLPWKALTRKRGSTFESIRNVYLHILAVYASWLETYFRRRELKGVTSQLSEKRFDTFKSVSQIRALDRKIDAVAKSVVAELETKDLDRKRWDKYRGKRSALTPREVIWHMIEEDFLHRGEIICMLWQDEIEPPYTSVWWWEYDSDPERHRDLWYRYPDVPRGSPGGYVSAKEKNPKRRRPLSRSRG
jgi:uncharacterized damage-inducible protein DinB